MSDVISPRGPGSVVDSELGVGATPGAGGGVGATPPPAIITERVDADAEKPWSDGGGSAFGRGDGVGAQYGLTSGAEMGGFNPIRQNKSRPHQLDIDPRTKLPIINIPAERRVSFPDLQDCVIHVFLDCFKITSQNQVSDRVLIITDQTLFLCGRDGSVARCTMVDQIRVLFVISDVKSLGIQIPSEYDILLKFRGQNERDKVIKVLRTVYRRLTQERLPVEMVKKGGKFDPNVYKVSKPPSFRLTIVPQRTVEELRKALEEFEDEEERLLDELDQIQDDMEEVHMVKMREIQSKIDASVSKLANVAKTCQTQDDKLSKLRRELEKGRQSIEVVDGPFEGDGTLPPNRDIQIAELQMIVSRLNAAVYAAESEQKRRMDIEAGSPADAAGGRSGVNVLGDLPAIYREKIKALNEQIQKNRSVIDYGRRMEQQLTELNEKIAFMKAMPAKGRSGPKVAGDGVGGVVAADEDINPIVDISDPAYAWVVNLPRDINVRTLNTDPRTGLRIVEVPEGLKQYFSEVSESVIHVFAVVNKPTLRGATERRVFIVSDQSLYLCLPRGTMKRCLDITDVDEIVVDTSFGIGFRSSVEYDMMFFCPSVEHRDEIVEVVQKLFEYYMRGQALPVHTIQRHQRLESHLNLVQPPNYVMPVTPFRSKVQLVEAIQEKRNMILGVQRSVDAKEGEVAVPSDVQMPHETYVKLRDDVARELDIEWRQDPALMRIREQLDNLQQQINAAQEEEYQLRKEFDEHSCEDGFNGSVFPLASSTGHIPSTGAGVYRPSAEGMFFINIEPIVMDCVLDVSHVWVEQDDLTYTAHPNGFVNIWDVRDGEGVIHKTLREHTGRISALQAHGHQLLTSSYDSTVRHWDIDSGRCMAVLQGHRGPVTCLHFSQPRMITGGNDATVRVWDMETGDSVTVLNGHHSGVVAGRVEGDMIVSAEWGWVLFWDARTGKVVRSIKDEQGGITCLDFSQGLTVVGGNAGDISVWDARNEKAKAGETIAGHDDDVHCIQIAGKGVMTSGADCKMRMWDLTAMKSLGVFDDSHPYETKSFRMAERRLAAGQGRYVKLWKK